MKIVVSVSPNKQQLHQHGLFETFSSSTVNLCGTGITCKALKDLFYQIIFQLCFMLY